MNPLLFAALPESGYIVLGCIVLGLIAFVGGGIALRFLRETRRELAEELKREITSGKEASAVSVQQPLVVAAQREFMDRTECTKIHDKIVNEFAHESAARRLIYKSIEEHAKDIASLKHVDERITRVEQAATTRSAQLEAKLDGNTQLTATIGGKVEQINQNVQLVLNALAQKR
jgi:hypothetical protein